MANPKQQKWIRDYTKRAKKIGITRQQFDTPSFQAEVKKRRGKTRAARRAAKGL